jgi:hypothetical protein
VGALLLFGQLLGFGACVALGLTVRNADVRCAVQVVTVPVGALAPEQQGDDVPCDAMEREARRGLRGPLRLLPATVARRSYEGCRG